MTHGISPGKKGDGDWPLRVAATKTYRARIPATMPPHLARSCVTIQFIGLTTGAISISGENPSVRASAEAPPSGWGSRAHFVRLGIVAAAYIAVSRAGLELDAVSGFAALVWPGSGIALAAILIWGYRLWPAIAVGALVTNLWAGAPLFAAIGIAAGNTGEAVVGAYLPRRIAGFNPSLGRVKDVVALIVLAAGVSTLVSASFGVASLSLSGIIPREALVEAFRAWWVGDAIGDLLVGTSILAWVARPPYLPRPARMAEAIALGLAVVIAAATVFGIQGAEAESTRGREYMLFPPLIWAALRFGLRGAVTGAVVLTAIAIVATSLGQGPFVRPLLHESLLALQTFMGISGGTIVLLGASISERRQAARDLRIARETAEAANRAKANFLGVVSHELRTPLNAITGYVDLLSLEITGPVTEKQRGILDRIVQSQRHLLSLIEDVLSFAQTEAGRLSLALQPVAVNEVIASIEPLVAPEMKRRNLALLVEPCHDDPFVRADPDKLRQVLLNLVTNAMKFTPAGGSISTGAEVVGDTVRIFVTDTGIGIASENVRRVFDPFFQVDQGGTRKYPGVGLGLSIVRDSVFAMGGDVAIESEPGKGTTVVVTLRRENPPAPGDPVAIGTPTLETLPRLSSRES